MQKFPENVELLDFFNSEPKLTDPDVPWVYNRLSFSSKLGEERVDCVIDNPGLEVRWFRQDVEIAFVEFFSVEDLSIQEYPGGKVLVAEGVGPDEDCTFRLQLRPRIHLSLKTSRNGG
jgi:hypothetical protein